jgi:chemosensory pili system protein ChpC
MNGAVTEVRGVLLPIEQANLLLPNLSVTEVVGYREATGADNAPAWLQGFISWNQKKIPLISFEYFLGGQVTRPGYRARIVLCHNPVESAVFPLIGILCTGIPRLARINADTLKDDDDFRPLPEMTLRHVYYADEEAWIPDLEAIASASLAYLTS